MSLPVIIVPLFIIVRQFGMLNSYTGLIVPAIFNAFGIFLLRQVGSPLDLYDTPANLFVAGFIGSPAMNFVNGKITGGQFVGDSGITTVAPANAKEGQRMVCGIRPDQIVLGDAGAKATIVVVEPTGAETQIVVDTSHEQLTCLQRERSHARPGDAIGVTLNPDAAHFFDAETGNRL